MTTRLIVHTQCVLWVAGEDKSVEFSQDIVDSFELLLQYTPLLDIMDARCSCNIVECLLRELAKVGLVTEPLVTLYSSKRESTSPVVPRLEQAQSQSASIPKVIIRAEPTLARILKTLDADYVKVQQEALLSVLCQVLTGKSFELILSVAIVEGKLRTFVTKLIKFNECSKQPLPGSGGETTKTSHTRAMLFDVSFLMLCSIVHTYGSEVGGAFIIVLGVVPGGERVHLHSSRGLVPTVVLSEEGGDSFFEQWVRECMVERGRPKCPDQMLQYCEPGKVDALLGQFNSPDNDFKTRWLEFILTTHIE
uniref:Mediator of RNA polymerase II transcription subunit 24 n=1 Tax=Timema shepardi TaxID=629360 RepID=A0A7R9BB93_TIMSH|nr:unnamed protein product [Timema shepardi]